jgi:HNH/ENDO VII superfamily nuclease
MRLASKLASVFTVLVLILARSASAQYDPSDPNYEYYYYYICAVDPYTCATLPPPGYVPPPPPPPSGYIADPQDTNRAYYPRTGDINGDGKQDLCITGDATRRVSDFMVVTSGGDYSLVPYGSMSQAMHNACQTWPVSSTSVERVSLQGNGYYDFMIDALNGLDKILVGTSGAGQVPTHILNFNEGARASGAEQIEDIISDPQDALAVYDTLYTVYVEWWIQVPDWSCQAMYPPEYSYMCPWTWVLYYTTTQIPGRDLYFQPVARYFVDNNRDLLQMGRPDECPDCYQAQLGELLAADPNLISRQLGQMRRMERGDIWKAAIACEAASEQGNSQACRRVMTLLGTDSQGYKTYACEAITDWQISNSTDTGPLPDTPEPSAGGSYITGGGIGGGGFRTGCGFGGGGFITGGGFGGGPPIPDPDGFNYNTPGERHVNHPWTDDGHKEAIKDLRANMELQNLDVPRGWAAHHMVPFRHNMGGRGEQLRALLSTYDINVNSAVNGVAVPTNGDQPNVPAERHSSLHGRKAGDELLARLTAAENSAGDWAGRRLAIQRALRQAAHDMSTGDFFPPS